jgi:site-specific recombinase XerD
MSLEPIDPSTALELYLEDKENDASQATLYSHRSRLGHFERWCKQNEVTNLNELSGRKLHEYRIWRRRDGNLAPVSEKTQMDTLRVFIRWLEAIDGVQQDLSTKVQSPSLDTNENVRDVLLESERASDIIGYLETYEYASLNHVVMAFLWHTTMRIGGAYALDVGDYDRNERFIKVRHRPDTETPIKNKERGERLVALSGPMCSLLDDWIADQRPQTTDDYGRNPLLTTTHGRLSKTSIRDRCYRYTRPCEYQNGCPHNRDLENCEALGTDHAPLCPSSVSPHAVRRGGITRSLNDDVPMAVISDRANVSSEVLEKHYDRRTEREKMEKRREFIGQT